MKLLIVDNTDGDGDFNEPLIKVISGLAEYEVVNYSTVRSDERSLGSYNAVVLSGVPLYYPFNSLDKRLKYFEWLRTTNVPIIGICLGHQILGTLFGARLLRNKEAESGVVTLHIVNQDSLFKNMPSNFQIETLHRGSITLPSEFTLLASSDKCVNVISRHSQKKLYGFQFHPERSLAGEVFFSNFLANIHGD
jgi:GMP synthase (glutamine-hydrolysing)